MSFFQRLERFRYPGESDREFSARIGCKHPQIAMWRKADNEQLSGVSAKPNPKTLGRIADNLGVEMEWLLWGDDK